jgi:hypothetical protein
MGSEIVFLFTPLCLAALVYLGYLASKPTLRVAAILCLFVSSIFSVTTVSLVLSYSFWTQAGFFSFAFLLAAIVALPVLIVLSKLIFRRPVGA